MLLHGGIRLLQLQVKELLMFDSRDVEEAFRRKPFLAPYKAYLDRVRGALYVLKRFPWMLRL
jgi:hypothetical protein